MIIVIFRMEVLGEKLKEFLQTVPVILSTTSQQPGCIHHHLCQDLESENRFFIIQEWEHQSELDAYWCSDRFSTFLGTFHLLKCGDGSCQGGQVKIETDGYKVTIKSLIMSGEERQKKLANDANRP